MPELDLPQSLADIAYSAGNASHPHGPAEIRRLGARRRQRRTAFVAAGSAAVVAATAVGALAISPMGDRPTVASVGPDITATAPAERSASKPAPSTPRSPAATLAADPFLTDATVLRELGSTFQPGFTPSELEVDCWPGIDVVGAKNLQLRRWLEVGPNSLSEYVMEYGTAEAADAAVSGNGKVWSACVPPEVEHGGALNSPTPLGAGDESFAYTTSQPRTAETDAFYTEVQIARMGRVVVVLHLFVSGDPPATEKLPQSLAQEALAYATGAMPKAATETPAPDEAWVHAGDLPARPFVTWTEGPVATRRSDFGFTVCDQDLSPSENGVTRQEEKSFGDEGAIATQTQLLFGAEDAASGYVASFERLFKECSTAQAAEVTVRAVSSDGLPISAWELKLAAADSSQSQGTYYGIARSGSVVTVIELGALPESADIDMADDDFVLLVETATDRLIAR